MPKAPEAALVADKGEWRLLNGGDAQGEPDFRENVVVMDDDTIKESAKAARAVAKTAGKAIQAGREVGRWLNKVFGKAIVNTVGLYWTDRVSARRIEAAIYDWKRLTLLFQRTEKELKRRGVKNTRKLAPKVALPLLEHATMENEPKLHVMWAHLLATALSPKDEAVTQTYVSILGEMTAAEARALEVMFAEWNTRDGKRWKSGPITYESGVDAPNQPLGIGEKLIKLGIIVPTILVLDVYKPGRSGWDGDEGSSEEARLPGEPDVVKFTALGLAFCKAVGMGRRPRRKQKS